MLPNFMIAGVSRSGTTSLYNYLNQHPEISFPDLKEPRYFSSFNLKFPQSGPGDFSVDNKLIKTFKDYENLYKNVRNNLVGDASSEYLYNYKSAVPEILNRVGDIPIILILRNPIERSYSAYNNLVRDGRETLTFEAGLKTESDRIKMGYDEMWHYKNVSLYYEPVKFFLESFSKLKIIIFEDFIKNENNTVKDVLNFLGVSDTKFEIDTKQSYSKSGKPKFKLISWLFGRNNVFSNSLRIFIFKIFGRKNIEKISKHLIKKNDIITDKTVKELNDFFKKDIEKLEKLLNLNLDIWKT